MKIYCRLHNIHKFIIVFLPLLIFITINDAIWILIKFKKFEIKVRTVQYLQCIQYNIYCILVYCMPMYVYSILYVYTIFIIKKLF